MATFALGSKFVLQAYEPAFVSIPAEDRDQEGSPEAHDELKAERKVAGGRECEGEDDEMVDVKAVADSANETQGGCAEQPIGQGWPADDDITNDRCVERGCQGEFHR